MYNENQSSPIINSNSFNDNLALLGGGGGIYNTNECSPNLTNVVFESNVASVFGGGIFNENSSNPMLEEITLNNNSAGSEGGGMYNNNYSSPSLTNVYFTNNHVDDNGGGMSSRNNSNPILTNVLFDSNLAGIDDAGSGGGMWNYANISTLNDVNFSNNSAYSSGGGMFNHSSLTNLQNVTFSGNSCDDGDGGGMGNYKTNSELTDVNFLNNVSTGGMNAGGMYNHSGTSVMKNVTFSSNTTNFTGGGVLNISGDCSFTDVSFINNSAGLNGGAIANYSGTSIFTNVTFSGNTTEGFGGALYNERIDPTLTNVTIFNQSAEEGAALYNKDSNPLLENVTIYANSSHSGGAIYNVENSHPTIENSIIWGNTPDQIFNSNDSGLTANFCVIQGGYFGNNNIDLDPILGNLTDNGGFTKTLALDENSPAIDAGNLINCPDIDQRYYLRPIDGNDDGSADCDMGSYEFGSVPALFSINIDIYGGGLVTKIPDKSSYLYGEEVSLVAAANPGWTFAGWSGDISNTINPISLRVTEELNISATFTQDEYILDIFIHPEGTGTFTIEPVKPTYQYGEDVLLTAIPAPGWIFSEWSGDVSSTDNPLTINIQGDTSVTAVFIMEDYEIYLPHVIH